MNAKTKLQALVLILAVGLLPTLVPAGAHAGDEVRTVKITAQRFKYTPDEITLKKGVPVVLELTSLDRTHGFSCPDLGIRADVVPGKPARISLTPDKTGRFLFHCDIFCGSGHEDMAGTIVVTD
jgi:cytochrome c oxidase subunit 2